MTVSRPTHARDESTDRSPRPVAAPAPAATPAPARVPVPVPEHRVRVVHFVSSFFIGGTERQAVATANGLDTTHFDVRMAAFDEGPLKAELDVPCQTFELQSLYRPSTLTQMIAFARSLRRQEIDVVHATGFYPNVFAVPAARLAGVPAVVASIRDLGDMWEPRHRRVQRLVCRLADRVVANAEAVSRRLVDEGYEPSRIVVIPNGVRCDGHATESGRRPLREEFGIPDEAPVAGVVARLTPIKGVEYFIEAAERLRSRVPEAYFVIVGGTQGSEADNPDNHEQRLRRRVAQRGLDDRVLFTGFRRDVPDVLRELTVSVMPSLSEGLSNVILESMAAALPVVATRVGGNPELVEDGVTGYLVPPRDPGELAGALGRLLADERLARELGRRGRRRAVREFSMEVLVRRTGNLYRELSTGPATAVEPSVRPGTVEEG